VREISSCMKFLIIILSFFSVHVFAIEVRSIARSGRMVQLDGFLMEWRKDSAKVLGADSSWQWDALNTKEGLAGYFKTDGRHLKCLDWTFRFLPHRLSPYKIMDLCIGSKADQSFYRIAPAGATPDSSLAAEWVIPWDSITVDSSGVYQIGLMAFDGCKDTLRPVIFTGRKFAPPKAPWGKVYTKGLSLAVLIVFLYYYQQRTKRKFTKRKKKMSEP
jgi:hypothetical protein